MTNDEIKAVIRKAPISVIDHLISEYIHDERNREISKRKIIDNVTYECLAELYGLTPHQCSNIVKKTRRIIVEYLS